MRPGGRTPIGALARTGLIIRLGDGDDRVWVHRLVAEVTGHHLQSTAVEDFEPGPDLAAGRAACAVTLLSGLFPQDPEDPATWPVCALLAAHSRTAVDLLPGHGTAAHDAGWLLNNLGRYLNRRGELAQAFAVTSQALTIFEAVYGPDHLDVARTLGNLGVV